MDSQQPGTPMGGADEEMYDDEEEVEVTRDDLITALREVVTNLSTGLQGADRESYLNADDLAQNDWFFAGISDQPGQYAVTMWPAEGDEDMLRIDIGGEEDLQALASNDEQIATLADDFIEGLSEEDLEDDYDEDEDLDEEEEFDEDDEEDEEDLDEEDTVSNNGNLPPR